MLKFSLKESVFWMRKWSHSSWFMFCRWVDANWYTEWWLVLGTLFRRRSLRCLPWPFTYFPGWNRWTLQKQDLFLMKLPLCRSWYLVESLIPELYRKNQIDRTMGFLNLSIIVACRWRRVFFQQELQVKGGTFMTWQTVVGKTGCFLEIFLGDTINEPSYVGIISNKPL